jgi:hypothetical protein
MGKPGHRQRSSTHVVRDPVSPDDVRFRLLEQDARMRADTRTEAEKWLGDPPP